MTAPAVPIASGACRSNSGPGPWTWGAALAGLLLGLIGVQWQASLPPPGPWLLGGLAGLLLAGLLQHAGRRGSAALLMVLALTAMAVGWASWRAAVRLSPALPSAWEGRELSVEVELIALPQAVPAFGERTLWRLAARPLGPALDLSSTGAASGASLMLPSGLSLWFDLPGLEPPRGGERWRFTLRLRRLHALQNPGLPDAELWLLERGLLAQGSVRQAERLAPAPRWSLLGLRQSLRERIQQQVPEPRARSVLAGLLIGDQGALASSDWALLRDTGVVHLFSISGVHITCFAWLAALALGALWRRQPRWCLQLPAPLVARWGGVLLATAYALLAGWGVPAQRTVALLLMVALLQSSGRLWPWPLALLLCALPIALADPWALVQPGFWLSFAAVALLMQQGHAQQPEAATPSAWRRGLRELLHTQAVMTLGLAPLTVLFFGQLSLVGVLANLLAVPAVTLLLTPLTLLGTLLPWAWSAAAAGVQLLFALLQQLASWPVAVWTLPQAPVPLQVLALLGLLLAALRLPRWLRGLGLALLLPLFLWQPARPAAGEFRLRVFDVGQGSAVWVQTASHDLLFDAGPRWGPAGAADAGARVLVPGLRAAGVRKLDLLLLSHGDADHAGGAASLLAAVPTARRLAPADPRLTALRPEVCAAGQRWDWDGVAFAILHPAAGQAARSANASSCVLRLRAASGSGALLAGDIEAPEELALLRAGVDLRADLLLLPHHGSASSSTPALLAAVAPRLAFAQSGYRNRHGHPALIVQTRLRELGLPLLSSAGCGAFDWHSGDALDASGCWRQQRARYWHQRDLLAPADDTLHAARAAAYRRSY